jgi:3-hydroxyisobutyrate dehydrogenase/2-hydroxy-3-oxopropionate reductase
MTSQPPLEPLPSERIAFLGLGRMGTAMAERLAQANGELVVWNRNEAKGRELAARLADTSRVTVAPSPADAVRGSTVVVSMLADEVALDAVLSGPQGALSTLAPGTLWVDMSTVGPAAVAAARGRLESRGASLVDAPVSGSVDFARSGTLTVMCGGSAADVARARSALAELGSRWVECGPSGAGAALKLGVNLVVGALNASLSEALVMVERAGVPRSTAFDLFTNSVVAAPFVSYKRAAFEDPEHAPVAFSLELVGKDLRLIAALQRQLGSPSDVTDAIAAMVEAACRDGLDQRDMSALAVHLRSQTVSDSGRG